MSINETLEGKKAALDKAIAAIEKQCGKGSLMKLTEVRRIDTNVVPTGFIGLDIALGVGGVPKGRIIEIFGPEGSGKSTLALEILAAVQKNGGTGVFIDAEHALDPSYAARLGVSLENLYVTQPDYGEQALMIADELVRSQAVDIIVIDSVAALTPKAEIEGDMGDQHMALQARMMSQALRKITAQVNQTGTIVIFINQIREKVGGYGNPEVTPGGRALKFYSSLRMEVRKKENLKGKGGDIIGQLCRISIKKNKVAPPFKECEMEILFGQGFSRESSLVMEAIKRKVIDKSGSWLSYRDVKLGQGTENAKNFLKDNPHIEKEIEEQVREIAFSGKDDPFSPVDVDSDGEREEEEMMMEQEELGFEE